MLSPAEKQSLLQIARDSVAHGLRQGRPLPVTPEDYPPNLRHHRACFVTLQITGKLRGCIGSLEAWRPLVIDCAENAYAAAFRDPRFPPVSEREHALLDYHISVLSKATPMSFDSEAALVSQLRPGIDGLILEDRGHRGTFLPSVWQQLPDPQDFLNRLKEKAGLPPNYWSGTLTIQHYTVEDIQ